MRRSTFIQVKFKGLLYFLRDWSHDTNPRFQLCDQHTAIEISSLCITYNWRRRKWKNTVTLQHLYLQNSIYVHCNIVLKGLNTSSTLALHDGHIGVTLCIWFGDTVRVFRSLTFTLFFFSFFLPLPSNYWERCSRWPAGLSPPSMSPWRRTKSHLTW